MRLNLRVPLHRFAEIACVSATRLSHFERGELEFTRNELDQCEHALKLCADKMAEYTPLQRLQRTPRMSDTKRSCTDEEACIPEEPQAKSEQEQAKSEQEQAKSEHIHYTACSNADVLELKRVLGLLQVDRENVSLWLGMPQSIVAAKLDGVMPMYQPEYDAIINRLRQNLHGDTVKPMRQQVIQFPR